MWDIQYVDSVSWRAAVYGSRAECWLYAVSSGMPFKIEDILHQSSRISHPEDMQVDVVFVDLRGLRSIRCSMAILLETTAVDHSNL